MSKIWKLICVLVFVSFVTGCGKDINLSSLSCDYLSTNKNASAFFSIGGFDIKDKNSIVLNLQEIKVKDNVKHTLLYLYDTNTSGPMTAQEIITNYDNSLGTVYFMTSHYSNLANEFEGIIDSSSASEHLKLCVEYIVFGYRVKNNRVFRDIWVADSTTLENVVDAMKNNGWVEDELYIFRRFRSKIETVEDAENTEISEGSDNTEISEGSDNTGMCDTTTYSPNTCAYYLGNAEDNDESCPAYWLNYVFQIVKYASIILVIVMDMIDLATAVAKEGIEPKLIKKCVMRLVICIIILLLPTLINSIGALFGLDGLLCGIK